MKNLFSSFFAALFVLLALGSCNRAEYAMLPQSAPYLSTTHVAPSAPAAKLVTTMPAATAEVAAATPTPGTAPETTQPNDNQIATTVTPAAVAAVAPLPATAASASVALSTTAALATPVPTAKMTRVQRFAASKALKMLSKASGVTQFKQKLNVAKTERVSGNLRTGIILILIGLIISLFSRVNSIFGLIGAIVAIIGLIFIVLWLLDNI